MNQLTKQQEEILRILQEECGEVVQMVSKVCRFGIDGQHLKDGSTNRERLAEELGDLACMLQLAVTSGIITEDDLLDAAFNKEEKLKKWSKIYE